MTQEVDRRSAKWAATLKWRKANPERWAATQLRWAKKNRERLRLYAAEHRKPDLRTYESRREQRQAQHAVERAVRDGILTRLERCELCGEPARTQAHHFAGYDKPLIVEWLCRSCHRKEHWSGKAR